MSLRFKCTCKIYYQAYFECVIIFYFTFTILASTFSIFVFDCIYQNIFKNKKNNKRRCRSAVQRYKANKITTTVDTSLLLSVYSSVQSSIFFMCGAVVISPQTFAEGQGLGSGKVCWRHATSWAAASQTNHWAAGGAAGSSLSVQPPLTAAGKHTTCRTLASISLKIHKTTHR